MSNIMGLTIKKSAFVVNNTSTKHQFFETEVARLMDRLYGTALRFTRNASDAEDMLSTTLEKAWNCLDSLEDTNRFDGWIMRILSQYLYQPVATRKDTSTDF